METAPRRSSTSASATPHGRAAFSLLELLVVLGLVSLVLATAALAWPQIDAAIQLDSGLHQIAADLHAAQTLAIASASRVRLVFLVGGGTYRRERIDDFGTYRLDVTRRLLPGVQIVDAVHDLHARGQA